MLLLNLLYENLWLLGEHLLDKVFVIFFLLLLNRQLLLVVLVLLRHHGVDLLGGADIDFLA